MEIPSVIADESSLLSNFEGKIHKWSDAKIKSDDFSVMFKSSRNKEEEESKCKKWDSGDSYKSYHTGDGD